METLRYVLLVNVLLAVVSSTYYVLLRRETFFGANRVVLWVGLLGALVLPLLELPDWRPQPVRTVMQRTARAIVPRVLPRLLPFQPEVTITFPNDKTYPAFKDRQTTFVWSWSTGFLLLYSTGVFLLLTRFGIQLASLRQLIRQSVHEPYTDFILVRNQGIASPFSFFRWVVLNPSQHNPYELEQILRHERVHVRERHSLDMIGAELVCIVFWFNPAAYLFRRLLHQTLEFRADRAVLAEGIDAKAYQYNLVKVSMAARQSTITNHFSKSQLKSRIVMLNKPTSPKASWLRYPVLCMTAFTIATTFARPQLQTLSKHLRKPIEATIGDLSESRKEIAQPVDEDESITKIKLVEPQINKSTVKKPPIEQVSSQLDSTTQKLSTDSVRVSPSRYITYQDNRMWWIITSRTTLDDLIIIKRELAKYNFTLQLREVRYDRFYPYIDRINYKLLNNISGNSTGMDSDESINKPIPSTGGYIEWGLSTNPEKYQSTSYGSISPTAQSIPDLVRKVIIEDEATVAELIRNQKMDPVVKAGSYKYRHLGDSSRTFKKDFFRTQSSEESGIKIQSNGSLAISEPLENTKIFINEEPVPKDAVGIWSVKQLYAVVKKSKYDPVNKKYFTSALLIYATEDN